MNPLNKPTLKMQRKAKRDRRRWVHADANKDGVLDKDEFKDFIFPTEGGVLIPETHEDLDSDFDGRVR